MKISLKLSKNKIKLKKLFMTYKNKKNKMYIFIKIDEINDKRF